MGSGERLSWRGREGGREMESERERESVREAGSLIASLLLS